MGTESTSSQMPLEGRRVLVVEDEYFLADDISKAFRELGAEIAGPVGHLEDALAILKARHRLDGAVLDINVRSDMIYPIARELRTRHVPFIFTTGYDRISIEEEFRDIPLIAKPIDLPAMAQRLAAIIGGQQE